MTWAIRPLVADLIQIQSALLELNGEHRSRIVDTATCGGSVYHSVTENDAGIGGQAVVTGFVMGIVVMEVMETMKHRPLPRAIRIRRQRENRPLRLEAASPGGCIKISGTIDKHWPYWIGAVILIQSVQDIQVPFSSGGLRQLVHGAPSAEAS